jgi:NhaA family Na+:H+ antiporter
MDDGAPGLPAERPIRVIVDPLRRFLHVESASGMVLLAATAAALILANSPAGPGFLAFWEAPFAIRFGAFEMALSLRHWINDLWMAVFFFVIGLEVKRELVLGELRGLRRAALPIAAALGGMAVPAGIYLALQAGAPGERGWGIPMATDIAFVVGSLAVLGARVPVGLRILLLSLAIADDIGAIIVIAVGYTAGLDAGALLWSLAGLAAIRAMMRLGVRSAALYLAAAGFVWHEIHLSGVHATIAGVILGLMTPAQAGLSRNRLREVIEKTRHFLDGEGWGRSPKKRYAALRSAELAVRSGLSPLERIETLLHPWVGYLIMPVFALANAGVVVEPAYFSDPLALSVVAGMVVGKPLGIVLFSGLAVKTGLARLPAGVTWGAVAGGGCLAGIGFTMALFIAGLALDSALLNTAKVGILCGSAASAALGVTALALTLKGRAKR